MTASFSHIDKSGSAHMVDVSDKPVTHRTATASAHVRCNAAIITALTDQSVPKGDVFATARIAGIQAAKKCSDLIPLCHPLPIKKVTLDVALQNWGVQIVASCKTEGQTGVEMEALTAASVAALTIYDMCKAIDKGMIIENVALLEKTGGKSGDYKRDEQNG